MTLLSRKFANKPSVKALRDYFALAESQLTPGTLLGPTVPFFKADNLVIFLKCFYGHLQLSQKSDVWTSGTYWK